MAVAALMLGGVTPAATWGQEEIPFPEAELFFELNDTDGDLGIHASIDGGPWVRLEIEDRRERKMLDIFVKGRLRRQGLTQLFIESAEPTFDELSPEEFFARFPEGEYEISAVTLEGSELESEVELSHVLPAPPEGEVNGEAFAEDCEADPLPSVSPPVTIDWDEVMESHPEVGTPGALVEIDRYQFFVEFGDVKLAVDLPPELTEFQVPAEILALGESGDRFKFEIIAREANLNNTAIESCFELD
jgi:hypothetical protein